MKKTFTKAKNVCQNCLYPLDAASDLYGEKTASPGNVTVCVSCGAIYIFNEDMSLREPTVEEMVQIVEYEEGWNKILQMQQAIRERGRLYFPKIKFTH